MFHIATRIGRIYLLVLIAGVVLFPAFASVAYAQIPSNWLAPSTSKPVYLIGEPVGLILTNTGASLVTWSNPPSVIHDCFVYSSSMQLVFDGRLVVVPLYYDPFTLLPGQSTSLNCPYSFSPGSYYFATTYPATYGADFLVIPEPCSLLAMLAGLGGLGGLKRRRN